MDARQLDRLMRETFGDDYRDKAVVGPVGSFRLADVFEEAGLRDPYAPIERESFGLWQTTSTPHKPLVSPVDNARAALEIARRNGHTPWSS